MAALHLSKCSLVCIFLLSVWILEGVKSLEVDLLGTCDPQQDICIAKYSSCEALIGNVNGQTFARFERKAGTLEDVQPLRVCTCLPGFSAVNLATSPLAAVRQECVPVEGGSCFTDGDCNLRNLDCINPRVPIFPTIFGANTPVDTLTPPVNLVGGAAVIALFASNSAAAQLLTQSLCKFTRGNTIEYKCVYPSPSKSRDSYSAAPTHPGAAGGKFGQYTNHYAGICQRVDRNEGYAPASRVGMKGPQYPGSQPHFQPYLPLPPAPAPPMYGANYGYSPYSAALGKPYGK